MYKYKEYIEMDQNVTFAFYKAQQVGNMKFW